MHVYNLICLAWWSEICAATAKVCELCQKASEWGKKVSMKFECDDKQGKNYHWKSKAYFKP